MDTSKINMLIDVIDNTLHDEAMPWHEPFTWVEQKTGVGRFRVLLTVICAISMNMVFGYGTLFFSNMVSFTYPAYQTVKIIETQRPLWIFDDTQSVQWVMYWMVYTAVMIVELQLKYVLALVPLYQLAKTVFIAWCFLPIRHNGSMYFYNLYLIKHGEYYD